MDLFEQFKIHVYYVITSFWNLEITNSMIFMTSIVSFLMILMYLGTNSMTIIPNSLQAFTEVLINFPLNICKENIGEKYYLQHAPFLLSIFFFILFGNLFGMIPYIGFTVTSHISVTCTLALMVWFYSILVGLYMHGIWLFRLFVPHGVPMFILPLIILIEILSFCMKPLTMLIRLFANMMAGHIMMEVFALLVTKSIYLALLPFIFICGLVGFEIFIACLQAYIFLLLGAIMIKDAIHLH